ncbi:MAG TPA: histidine kinase [Cytophagales bacterium]|jgi:sensor histidine kinase YesM
MSVSDFYSNFIFSDRPRYRIARHVSFWLATTVFFGLIYGNKVVRPGLWVSFVEALMYLPTHMLTAYFLMYWVLPRYLLRGKYVHAVAAVAGITGVVAFLSYLISSYITIPYRFGLGLPLPYNTLFAGLMSGLRGANTVAGFAAAIKLTKYWYQKNQLAQQLEREKLSAELQLLKAQVHPHFLFNTLNNLYALTLLKSDHAPEVVLKLSALLRYMLYECNAPLVPLGREIRMMLDYVELEKLRYGDRLDLALNVQGDPGGKAVAPLLLLPFLENAFKHGASEQLDQAWIAVDLAVKGNLLKMKLINGIPEAPEPGGPGGEAHGIGLQNVRKRLDLLYPGRHELKILREAETFVVTLSISLETNDETRGTETGGTETGGKEERRPEEGYRRVPALRYE